MHLSHSFGRRPIILFVCLSGGLGYYVGYLNGTHPEWPASQWPAPTPDKVLVPTTVTLREPQATVTVTTEAFSPRAELRPVLNGTPTAAFKDNLRPDVQYVTAWPASGFTNDFMGYMNLIYLGLLTERVPIIPSFTPSHVTHFDTNGPRLDFGAVFDIPRLERELGKPVLEWSQVKDQNSVVMDQLGCWNIWEAVSVDRTPRAYPPPVLKIDASYTVAPKWVKLLPNDEDDPHIKLSALVSLAFPGKRESNLQSPVQSPVLEVLLEPDHHLLCFDHLYWVVTLEQHEMFRDYSPSWRFVGQYIHWVPRIEGLAHTYLRQAFALAPAESIPQYIAIHVRHGDFAAMCDGVPELDCFAPLIAYARRVEEVRAEILKMKGIAIERVVMTSDEQDPAWWDAVRALGWAYPDHTNTVQQYGKWYPILVDGAIQSGSLGFVGTDESTVSMVASRRIKSWRGGAARMVKWGKLGADDH
ncbi:hypothetical protein DFH07DRAFT_824466 [Mycena maculata]|uniref:Uncharacterized protein n=1 Tax=Mycena maculata TaxID=230809 RepID=A0AAD7IY83_9AGAR|nr:hypothetical protein DFH07DRAFT_824466 [Mycena maculata]